MHYLKYGESFIPNIITFIGYVIVLIVFAFKIYSLGYSYGCELGENMYQYAEVNYDER